MGEGKRGGGGEKRKEREVWRRGGVAQDVGDRGRLRIRLGVEYDQGRRGRRKAINGGESGEGGGGGETSRGDHGANGALTVLHSGSSISVTLCVSV